MSPPLLVIDGDSLAHRAYHALPKSINKNAVVGFTNMLTRLWEMEEPRTVFVGWDTLTVPTYRHKAFEAYQSGRHFDDSLLEQLDLLPELVEALSFATAKAPGYEADDFVAAAVRSEGERGGEAVVVTSDRDLFQLASDRTVIVTTHVSPLKAAVGWALGVDDAVVWRMFVAPGSVTRIAMQHVPVLVSLVCAVPLARRGRTYRATLAAEVAFLSAGGLGLALRRGSLGRHRLLALST